MKEIIPKRIIIDLNPDGTVARAFAKYNVKDSGVTERRSKTMGVKEGFSTEKISAVIAEATSRVYTGEGIDEAVVKAGKAAGKDKGVTK